MLPDHFVFAQLSKYPALNKLEAQVGLPKVRPLPPSPSSQLTRALRSPPARLDPGLTPPSPPPAPLSQAYVILGAGSVFSSLIFFNIFAGFLSNLLGWALPAYLSLKALETPGHDDDTQWLTYWVIFGAFNFLESVSSLLVAWFPYYYTFKTIFILYLILPSTRGATVVFNKAFKPLLAQHKTQPIPVATPAQ